MYINISKLRQRKLRLDNRNFLVLQEEIAEETARQSEWIHFCFYRIRFNDGCFWKWDWNEMKWVNIPRLDVVWWLIIIFCSFSCIFPSSIFPWFSHHLPYMSLLSTPLTMLARLWNDEFARHGIPHRVDSLEEMGMGRVWFYVIFSLVNQDIVWYSYWKRPLKCAFW